MKRRQIHLNEDLHKKVRVASAIFGVTMLEIVNKAVSIWLSTNNDLIQETETKSRDLYLRRNQMREVLKDGN